MSEIVNLRRVRKAKVRAAEAEAAAVNRARFGRPRAEREATEQMRLLDSHRLEGHRLDHADAPPLADGEEPGAEAGFTPSVAVPRGRGGKAPQR